MIRIYGNIKNLFLVRSTLPNHCHVGMFGMLASVETADGNHNLCNGSLRGHSFGHSNYS